MQILVEDFNAKVERENIFKPTIGNQSLHQDSNDDGVRMVKFDTSKNLAVKRKMFTHRNIHKYIYVRMTNKMHDANVVLAARHPIETW
jgi:hypothetical protein